jgi:hypothetical protein
VIDCAEAVEAAPKNAPKNAPPNAPQNAPRSASEQTALAKGRNAFAEELIARMSFIVVLNILFEAQPTRMNLPANRQSVLCVGLLQDEVGGGREPRAIFASAKGA